MAVVTRAGRRIETEETCVVTTLSGEIAERDFESGRVGEDEIAVVRPVRILVVDEFAHELGLQQLLGGHARREPREAERRAKRRAEKGSDRHSLSGDVQLQSRTTK
jgi:hypothetical protein